MNSYRCFNTASRRKFFARVLFCHSIATAFVLPAYAQPVGGQVSAGAGTIDQTVANTTTISQTTQNLAINWQSFEHRQ